MQAISRIPLTFMFFAIFALASSPLFAQASLRRPVSSSQPMLMIHADVWNSADPQKIIDLVPEDLRPYVVINISLSINHDATTGKWLTSEYGYSIAKSWIRTAAENRMWATIQPSSGGFTHFPDYDTSVDLDTTIYGEFYRDYPNFIGINYAEQFWGYDDKWSLTWMERADHWSNLVKQANKYGGYVIVSFTGGFWGAGLNPVAMVKRNANLNAALRKYAQNFIIEEKFTMAYGFHDVESTSMGMWLSGFAGNYGIRFDECGWVPNASEKFPPAAGAIPYLEHMMLTGETVVDGPELIWQQSIKSLWNGTTADGYSIRKWEYFPQFVNITLDGFRKILDGTIRILSRQEVVDRTKLVIVSDMTTGSDRDKYHTPLSLFQGLYLMDNDGTGLDQKSWFKKNGRYPAIPIVYQLLDDVANSFQVKINRSAYDTRWPTLAAKQAEMNTLFPEEYTGDIYASRHENGWVTYNPYKTGATASGSIPFQYNTADKLEVVYSQYTLGIVKEYAEKVMVYLTNYDNIVNTGAMNDVLKFHGCESEPSYSYTDRGSHIASALTKSWSNNVFTLNVSHNGPVDLVVNCSGAATSRATQYTAATITAPASPAIYQGPRQYEAENFDVKSVNSNVTNGTSGTIRNYEGLGYVKFGTNATASIRDTVRVLRAGFYRLETRYSNAGSNVETIELRVNGTKVATPVFKGTAAEGTFVLDTQLVKLVAGVNVIGFQANASAISSVIFDNIVLTSTAPVPPSLSLSVVSTSLVEPADVSFQVSASDSDGTVSHIDFLIGDSLFHSEWVAPYDFVWSEVPAGTYSIRAIAYDDAGNMTRDSLELVVAPAPLPILSGRGHSQPQNYSVFDLHGRYLGAIRLENGNDAHLVVRNKMHWNAPFLLKAQTSPPSHTLTGTIE